MRSALVRRAALCGLFFAALTTPALAAGVSVGHSGWDWGDPLPQGQDLNAVAFDGSTGFAVGNFGTVVRSQDGGATWTGLASGTFENLSVVQELSPSVVVVGGGCSVRESVNGGTSFVSLPINSSESSCDTPVSSLSFLDQNTGFVELQDGSILFTSDAGQTVSAKTSAPVGEGQGDDLDFVSPTTGFAVSGGGGPGLIERTTDAASSWTEVGSSTRGLNSITFVTPSIAYAVGDQNTLLESTDGGATWAAQPLALPAGAGPFDLEHIACSSPSTCLISTADGAELIRTADGGQTGTIVTSSSQLLFDVAFASGTDLVGVGVAGATVLSADAGVTFSDQVSSRQTLAFSSGTAGIRAGGVAGDAYIMGDGGQIAATVDSGASWNVLRVPGDSSQIDDVAFPTSTAGYALSNDDQLNKTTDGGTSWQSLDTGVSRASALAAPSTGTVLLIGPHGVHRSVDGAMDFSSGGKVTVSSKPKRTMALSKLALDRSLTIQQAVFAWGAKRLIESTTSGRTWRLIPVPLPRSIEAVSFVSATTGYVLQRGNVFFTRNRGRTWKQIDSLGTTQITSGELSFSSVKDGFVGVSYPSDLGDFDEVDLLRTTNGGQTWQPEVIDGNESGVVLATHGVSYFADQIDNANGNGNSNAFFDTINGGLSPQTSSLSISIGKNKRTAKALRKAGHKINLKGKLNPVTSVGEQVLISHRSIDGRWLTKTVRVASNGAFSLTIRGVHKTTDVVAQALGDGVNGGVGTKYSRLTVKG